MSLTSSYETEIKIPEPQLDAFKANIKGTPCFDILQLAIDKVCKDRQGTQSRSYADCQGTAHPVLMAISTPGLPNGIGIDVNSERRIVFKYDQQGANIGEAQAIASEVNQVYATISHLRVLGQLGYRVSAHESMQKNKRFITINATRE